MISPGLEAKIKEIVFQLSGSASMCWEPVPHGVFDTKHAEKFSNEAIEKLKQAICTEYEYRGDNE